MIMGNHFESQFREDYNNFLSQNNEIEFDSAVDPLMQWLVSSIQASCDTLTRKHFTQLLNELWLRVTTIQASILESCGFVPIILWER